MRSFPFCQGAGIHEGDLLDKSWHEVIEKAVSCSLDGKTGPNWHIDMNEEGRSRIQTETVPLIKGLATPDPAGDTPAISIITDTKEVAKPPSPRHSRHLVCGYG